MRLARILAPVAILMASALLFSQVAPTQDSSFEVATIKPTPPDYRGGRFITMQGVHQFVAKTYTLKYMVAAAYNLPMQAISVGPAWTDADPYDILASTPGEARPSLDEQMSMLRKLLADRFKLAFHRERKELSIYALTVGKNGAKLKESASPDQNPVLVNRLFPDHV